MIKYEARLVVLGNEEDPTDQDFFSPTCNHKALVIVLALAADENVKLSSLDIKGFFLTAKIEEPDYIKLPKNMTNQDLHAPSVF